jgi:uncharacterized membrane protein
MIGKILKCPWLTALTGVALAVIISLIMGQSGSALGFVVWLHVIVGIMWIGLLYYFNFVQVPAMAAVLNDKDTNPTAINKYIAPKALWFFRWAALLTWLTGITALAHLGNGMGSVLSAFLLSDGMAIIGIGAWLGTIMLLNVWGLIWPNQKKILGIVPASAEEIAKAKVIALYASRTNTLLSIPMLLSMVGFGHGGLLPF